MIVWNEDEIDDIAVEMLVELVDRGIIYHCDQCGGDIYHVDPGWMDKNNISWDTTSDEIEDKLFEAID